jgi:phosphoribosyl 1,2-cyclic phosphodiesterase
MAASFCVLGSGSSGNAALVRTPGGEFLLDAGFASSELGRRLNRAGSAWENVRALVLTHLHSDHLKRSNLSECVRRGIRVFMHAAHARELSEETSRLGRLQEAGLLHRYGSGAFEPVCGTRGFPFPLSHDARPTFGFRLEIADAGRTRRLAYLADLGVWSGDLDAAIAGVDLLALEFNHDARLERESGRPWRLIERVLGPEGHLSNAQAAEVFERVIALNGGAGPRRLVQLHLSRECNTSRLAYQAAREVVLRLGACTRIYGSRQEAPGEVHEVE